ncbi:MAG TPA: hypothetical protein VIJ75_00550 [Hanamia sp.]
MKTEDTGEEIKEIIQSTTDLKAAIKRLERRRFVMEDDLQEKFHEILDGLKPMNILKTTLHEVQESVPLRNNLLKLALGLGAGYFSRKFVVGKSAGFVKKALGTALQFGVTHLVAKKEDDFEESNSFKNKAKNIFRRILSI